MQVEGRWDQFWANVGRCLIMSLLLNAHIELYGLSQAFLGDMVRHWGGEAQPTHRHPQAVS